jgi:hypothetical protein
MKKQILIGLCAIAMSSTFALASVAVAQESTQSNETLQAAPTSNGVASTDHQQSTANDVGGAMGNQSQTGSSRRVGGRDRGQACVGPVSFCNVYFGN